jgi:hypothetical protein
MGKEPLTKKQIKRIVYLRKHGHSLPEIRRLTGHGKATIFKYIQEVSILPQFQDFWKNKRKSSVCRMLQEQKRAQGQAKKLIKKIGRKEKIIIAACFYWAEGSKGDFTLSNTDPFLIKTFVSCLGEIGIGKERLSINLRIYEDLDKEKACIFWSKLIGVPKKNIKYVDVLKGKKNGKLPYGMCRIRVIKGGYFLKLVTALRDVIKVEN